MKRQITQPADFHEKTTLWLAIAALFILTPFAINNFIYSRYVLGFGSMAIIIILSVNAWSIRHNKNYQYIVFLGLVPAILFFLLLAIVKQKMVGVMWCYPAVISFYMILPERKAWIANTLLLITAIPVAWNIIEITLAIRMTATLLSVSIFSAIFTRVLINQQNKLQALAETDPLTGLYNRTILNETLERAILLNNRTGEPMTLITIDLDHFKSINDALGHDAGDTVLKGVADLLNQRMRRIDKIFRLGGEEFLVLLHGTDVKNGKKIAEELRTAISSLTLIPDQSITASIGVATLNSNEELTSWMKRSDENLYRAKLEGRNKTVA